MDSMKRHIFNKTDANKIKKAAAIVNLQKERKIMAVRRELEQRKIEAELKQLFGYY